MNFFLSTKNYLNNSDLSYLKKKDLSEIQNNLELLGALSDLGIVIPPQIGK